MITTINEFKQTLNENNHTFFYMVTQDGFGEYDYEYELDDSDYNDFIHNATNVLTGKMSLEEMQQLNIKVLDYSSNPIQIIPGQSLVTLNYDQLRDILENNYNDYLDDLDEGDSVILSTEISSNDL